MTIFITIIAVVGLLACSLLINATQHSVDMDSTGKYMVAASDFNGGGILLSDNYGMTWTVAKMPANSSITWPIVQCDALGQVLLVSDTGRCVDEYGQCPPYVSHDRGLTWNAVKIDHDTTVSCTDVAVSGNGKVLLLVCRDFTSQIYHHFMSADRGINWSIVYFTGSDKESETGDVGLALDFTGTSLLANFPPGQYMSNDSGVSWFHPPLLHGKTMPSASIADSGRYLAAMYSGNDSGLLISNDFGNTWMAVRQFASTAVGAVSMSGNGQFAYLITDVAADSYIMVYDRQRDLLTQLPSPKTMWTSISTDGNGQHVLAVSLEGDSSRAGLYVSNDFGNTWTKTHDIK